MSLLREVTTKEHYGLHLVLALANTYLTNQPLSLTTVSQQKKISVKYLEQLVAPFRRAGWVKSQRGRNGGYLMMKNPKNTSLKEVIWLLAGGDIKLVKCLANSSFCPLGENKNCQSKKAWRYIQRNFEKSLEQVKLSELLK